MKKIEQLEWKLLTCDVVCVIDWFDEEQQQFPWNYVRRKEGGFEGIATVLLDGEDDSRSVTVQVSVGVFDNEYEAVSALRRYDGWLDAVEKLRRMT